LPATEAKRLLGRPRCRGDDTLTASPSPPKTRPATQSLYPADSVPKVVERINNAFQRADQIAHAQGKSDTYWFAPIVADAGEGGFGLFFFRGFGL
jgi:isocitrate lyase